MGIIDVGVLISVILGIGRGEVVGNGKNILFELGVFLV